MRTKKKGGVSNAAQLYYIYDSGYEENGGVL